MLTDDRRVVPLTLLAQAGVTVGLAVLLGIKLGKVVAVSTLLGGTIAVVPNAFLAARLLAPRRNDDAMAVLRSAWIGELGKWLLTALLFGAIFLAVRPLSAPAVFAGFIAAQGVIFGALWWSGGAQDMDFGTKS